MEEKKQIDNTEIFLTAFGICAIFLSLLVVLFVWFDVPNFIYLLLVFMMIFSASVVVYVKKFGNEQKFLGLNDTAIYLYFSNCLFITALAVLFNAWFLQNTWAIILVFVVVFGLAFGYMIGASEWGKLRRKTDDFIILPLIITVTVVFWAAVLIHIRTDSLQAQIVMMGCLFVNIVYCVIEGRTRKKREKSEIENPKK